MEEEKNADTSRVNDVGASPADADDDFNGNRLVTKSLSQIRDKLRSACYLNDPEKIISIFDGYVEKMNENKARWLHKKDLKIQEVRKALKKSLNENEKLKEQCKKYQEEIRLLKEENMGLKRTVKGIKIVSKMSEEKRASMLSMPKTIKPEGGSSSSSGQSSAMMKFKRAAAVAAASASPMSSFQASLSSGLSSLNSLVASVQILSRGPDMASVPVVMNVSAGTGTGTGTSTNSSSSGSVGTGEPKRRKRKNSGTSQGSSDPAASASSGAGTGGESDGTAPKKQRYGKPCEVPFPLLKRAFEHYVSIYGHMIIMKSFIIPFDNSWPEEMWGIKLGPLSMRIRNCNGYKENRKELVSMCLIPY
jgi:hypothetical protein